MTAQPLYAVPDPDNGRAWAQPTDQPATGWTPVEDTDRPDTDRFRLPTAPAWLRDADTRRAVLAADGRRIALWALWTVTGGLVVAYLRLWVAAPRSALRFVAWWWHWVSDDRRYAESRADLAMTGRGDPEAVQAGHDSRVRRHTSLSALVVAGAVVAVLGHVYRAPLVSWGQLVASAAVAVPLAGLAGRDSTSRPLFDVLHIAAASTPPVTLDLIVDALRAVGVVKPDGKGPRPHVIQPPARTRTGWETILDLPMGATVSDVITSREAFAGALSRSTNCVWLSQAPGDDSHARRLRVIVNRRPLRSMDMPEWPWRHGGTFNWFRDPVAVGIDEVGDPVTARKAYRSTVYGGLQGSGKTVAMLNAILCQAVDPRVELHIYDLKGGNDWAPLAAIAHTYVSGTDPEDEAAVLDDLEALVDRMVDRFRTLRQLPEDQRSPKTTDALASTPGLDLHPIVIVIDETQEMFEMSDHRDRYVKLVARLIKRGRGVGITVEAGTQEVKKATLPIAGLCHFRHCLAVQGHTAVDLVLGTGAYRAGHDADALSSDDVGIGYFGSGKAIGLVRGYWLRSADDGADVDEVRDVCERLRVEREDLGLLSGMAAGLDRDRPERTDGAPEHALAVAPVDLDRVAFEDLGPRMAAGWPSLYRGWLDLDPEAMSRAVSTALGDGFESVTCGAGKGDRRPRGIRVDDLRRMVADRTAERTSEVDTDRTSEVDTNQTWRPDIDPAELDIAADWGDDDDPDGWDQ